MGEDGAEIGDEVAGDLFDEEGHFAVYAAYSSYTPARALT